MTTSPTDPRLARLALAGLTAIAFATMVSSAAQASSSSPAIPPGATEDQVQAGAHVFQTSTCNSCHGTDARGTEQGPDLGSGHWLWSGGDLAGIRGTIVQGVHQPKQFGPPMPPWAAPSSRNRTSMPSPPTSGRWGTRPNSVPPLLGRVLSRSGSGWGNCGSSHAAGGLP